MMFSFFLVLHPYTNCRWYTDQDIFAYILFLEDHAMLVKRVFPVYFKDHGLIEGKSKRGEGKVAFSIFLSSSSFVAHDVSNKPTKKVRNVSLGETSF